MRTTSRSRVATRRLRGLFVTGTDTGVGKTQVTAALVRALRRRGISAVGLKPVETGCDDGAPADARLLAAAAEDVLPLERVCAYRFAPPVSPAAAARAAGRRISLARLQRLVDDARAAGHLPVVEGAGGLLAPLTSDGGILALAERLLLPLVVVARSSLGTINHSLLTLEVARAAGLPVAAVVLNRTLPRPGPDEATNPAENARRGRVRVLGPLPHVGGTPAHRLARLASLLEAEGWLDALLAEAEAAEDRV